MKQSKIVSIKFRSGGGAGANTPAGSASPAYFSAALPPERHPLTLRPIPTKSRSRLRLQPIYSRFGADYNRRSRLNTTSPSARDTSIAQSYSVCVQGMCNQSNPVLFSSRLPLFVFHLPAWPIPSALALLCIGRFQTSHCIIAPSKSSRAC